MPSSYDKALPPARPRWEHSVVLELLGGSGSAWLGDATARVWEDARASLAASGAVAVDWDDIMSEAMEAALTLGL